MHVYSYFVGLSLAALLLASPATGLADDKSADRTDLGRERVEEPTPEFAADPSRFEADASQDSKLAATDFCYAGSSADPATDEILDFFVFCDESSTAAELDLA